jgi:hypothetical protein
VIANLVCSWRFLLVGRVGVVAVERDRGGVVVPLVKPHAELGDGVSRDRQGEGTAVVLEQSVETPPHAVVIERGDLPFGEPEQFGDMPRRPLADAVEGLARHEQVLEEDQKPDGRIDAATSVLRGQIGAEVLPESQAFEDAIEDWKDADAIGMEVVSGRFGAMADLDGDLGIIGVLHRGGSGRQGRKRAGVGSLAWPAGSPAVRMPREPPPSLSGGGKRQGVRY